MHGISYRPTDLSLLKEFSKKKSVLKIFIILFEQDCPEAVVHAYCNHKTSRPQTFSPEVHWDLVLKLEII